jgi:DNA-binding PadR family transcriptional regulator
MTPVFARGDLRLYLLKVLSTGPRHGYEIIRSLEDRFLGMYTPSPGTIYPRLAALQEDGLVEHDEVAGRKVFRLTEAGAAELESRAQEIDALEAYVTRAARNVAREVRDEVRASVRDLRRELKGAATDVRREERRAGRARRHDVVADTHRLRSLQHDLEAFANDVLAAARQYTVDESRLRVVRDVLLDARTTVEAALRTGKKQQESDAAAT